MSFVMVQRSCLRWDRGMVWRTNKGRVVVAVRHFVAHCQDMPGPAVLKRMVGLVVNPVDPKVEPSHVVFLNRQRGF